MNTEDLRPHRHSPPPDWPPEVFEEVTDALASALVAALERESEARNGMEPAR